MKILKSILIILNLLLLLFTIYILLIDGNNISKGVHPEHYSLSKGVEYLFRMIIRIASIIILLISIIYYILRKKNYALIHIALIIITIITTFIKI